MGDFESVVLGAVVAKDDFKVLESLCIERVERLLECLGAVVNAHQHRNAVFHLNRFSLCNELCTAIIKK